MLDTIRDYAASLLKASGQAETMRRRQVDYFLSLVEWEERPTPQIAELVAVEYDNLRSGLAWAVEGAPDAALHLVTMLWRTWAARGMLAEGRGWLDRALNATAEEPSPIRASALVGATTITFLAGDLESCRRLGNSAVDLARAVGDPPSLVAALNILGGAAVVDSQYEDARRLYEEAVAVARTHDDELGLAAAIGNLGTVDCCRGRWADAIAHYTEQLALRTDWPFIAVPLLNIALADLQNGHEASRAATRYEEVFRRASESGDAIYVSAALHGLGLAAAGAGHAHVAARVLGAAMADHERLGYTVEFPERIVHEETVERLRAGLGLDAFAAAWSEGGLLSPREAASLALDAIQSDAAALDPSPPQL
jgi:non-specific serine/threonine protein kinase